uniref:Replication protein A n=1 Tax=Leptospirillum sp. Group II '5-way CG' TaxID=419541 RepID=B6AQX8_9BACT|nr:MAG: replication protein A [Leptospirillum sp. Group II '5-way CG']
MSAPARAPRPVDILKNLPQNLDAEKSFLGSIFLDNQVIDREILTSEDFFLDSHKKIYQAILEMWEDRIPVDSVTLSDRLEKKGWSGLTGGSKYVDDLACIVPTAANAKHYARILKEKTEERQAIFDADRLQKSALSGVPDDIARVRAEIAKREDPDDRGFTIIHPCSVFKKTLPPPVYVLPSLRPRTVGLIVAQEGTGKSFLALEVALAKATGHDMTGIGVTGPGGVVYFSKEDPPEIIEERLQAIGPLISSDDAFGRADNLEIVSLYGKPATLVSEKTMVNEKLVRQIIKSGFGKDLLIFDTLRKLHDLEENSSGEMKVLLEIFDRIALETGAAVLLIHHTNKSSNLNGQQGDQSSARGSNAIVGNTRWSLHLETVKSDAGEKRVKVTIPRASYGPEGGEWWLERTEGGVLVQSEPVVADASQRSTKKPPLKKIKGGKDDGEGVNGGPDEEDTF